MAVTVITLSVDPSVIDEYDHAVVPTHAAPVGVHVGQAQATEATVSSSEAVPDIVNVCTFV